MWDYLDSSGYILVVQKHQLMVAIGDMQGNCLRQQFGKFRSSMVSGIPLSWKELPLWMDMIPRLNVCYCGLLESMTSWSLLMSKIYFFVESRYLHRFNLKNQLSCIIYPVEFGINMMLIVLP